MPKTYRVMLVDDEPMVLSALRRLLAATPCIHRAARYPVVTESYDSPLEALERARHTAYDLFIADYRMPGLDGVGFLREVKAIQPSAARMILSGYADLNSLIGAINEAEIYRFLSKPWNDYEFVSSVAQALAFRELLIENQRLADEVRLRRGQLTPQDYEARRLEEQEPGITKVNWGADGEVLLDDMDAAND